MTRGEGADLPDLLSKICVLVVDDEPGMRNFLVKTLSPLCRAVDAVGDTEAASGMSSKPATATSSGTRNPRSSNALMAPTAIRSLPATLH
mgnify:CR=1 FL=1